MKAIVVNTMDNVATALVDLEPGETVEVRAGNHILHIPIKERIPFGHKFAIYTIPLHEKVVKYGKPIGQSNKPIQSGEWVHSHNVE